MAAKAATAARQVTAPMVATAAKVPMAAMAAKVAMVAMAAMVASGRLARDPAGLVVREEPGRAARLARAVMAETAATPDRPAAADSVGTAVMESAAASSSVEA